MESFFELTPKQQADRILQMVIQQKQSRNVPEYRNEIYFQDLKWKLKEIEENKNPIPIPQNTPWRLLKRIIGKLIRFYTRRQVHYNISMASFAELVSMHLESLQKQILSLENKLNDQKSFVGTYLYDTDQLKKKMFELEEKSDLLRKKVFDIEGKMVVETDYEEVKSRILDKLYALQVEFEAQRESMIELKEIFENYGNSDNKYSFKEDKLKINSRIDHLYEWLSGLDTVHQNLYKWVELIGKRTDQLEQFQDRVRKELFAELKYSSTVQRKDVPEKPPQIVNAEKLTECLNQNVIKINLGCGTDIKNDFINIDARALPGVDIIADVRNVPFSSGTVDVLYLSHVIEHFPEVEMTKVIMPYWYDLLKPGGKIVVICPDWEAMLDGYARGEISYEALKEVTFGSQEYEGNFHYSMYKSETLTSLLNDVGFRHVRVIDKGRKNGLCFELEVEGVK
jgi:predicted SAM-dependent methyltransferase